MVKSTEAMSARARARQAKAELDAKRAEQDRLVLDAATEFYEAAEALVAAHEAAAAAEQRRTESVSKLAGLAQSDEQIGTLCGITAKQVRELRRLGATAEPKTQSRRRPGQANGTPVGKAPALASDA